jgi:hypothetical protein
MDYVSDIPIHIERMIRLMGAIAIGLFVASGANSHLGVAAFLFSSYSFNYLSGILRTLEKQHR